MIIYEVEVQDIKSGQKLFGTEYFGSFEPLCDYILIHDSDLSWCQDWMAERLDKTRLMDLLKRHLVDLNEGMIYLYRTFDDLLSELLGSKKDCSTWQYVIKTINVKMK